MMQNVLSRAARRIAPMVGALSMALHAIAAGPDIAELAPQRSFLVVSVPDWAELARAFEASDLGKLWNEPQVKSFVEKALKEESEQVSEFLKDLNLELEDFKPPTGQVGVAMFLPEKAAAGDTKGSGLPNPHMLITADLGENAGEWEDALERLIEHGEKGKHITTEEETFAGVRIRVLKPIYAEVNKTPEPPPGEDQEEFQIEQEEVTGGLGGFLGGSSEDPRQLYIGRVGDTFLAATDLRVLEAAIDGLSGKHQPSIADSQAFRDAAAQRSASELAYATFFPSVLLERLFETEDGDSARQVMTATGITDVQAVTMGMRMNTPEAIADMSFALLAAEKKGLLGLLADSGGAFEPPNMVAPDAATVTRIDLNFSKLPDLVRAVAATMGGEQQKMITGFLDQFANIIVPTLEAMGPQVYATSSYTQPLGAESQLMTLAIELKDQGVIANTIALLLGSAQGMVEPREFEGNTIYSSQMFPVAVGLGFNRLFVGQEAGIENAMRLSGRADAGRLADEPRFRAATAALAPGGIVYSYTDIEQLLRWTYWELQNEEKIAEQMLDDAGYEGEEKDAILKGIREEQPKWLGDLPPVELLLRHAGDTVSELHSTPQGFRGRSLLLRPGAK
jgi:hypothetical protein